MAMTVGELRKWLARFHDTDEAAIDEGGLTLEVHSVRDGWLEIGGWPLDEDEEE